MMHTQVTVWPKKRLLEAVVESTHCQDSNGTCDFPFHCCEYLTYQRKVKERSLRDLKISIFGHHHTYCLVDCTEGLIYVQQMILHLVTVRAETFSCSLEANTVLISIIWLFFRVHISQDSIHAVFKKMSHLVWLGTVSEQKPRLLIQDLTARKL